MALLTVLVVLGTTAWADETPPGDAAQFLKEKGLEGIHATSVDFLSAMIAGKPGTAMEILDKSFLPSLKAGFRKNSLETLTRVSSGMAEPGPVITDVELVGYRKISGKTLTLYYVLNGSHGPVLTAMVIHRYQNAWYVLGWVVEGNLQKLMEQMNGVVPFSKSIVVPIHGDEKKGQDEKATGANDSATKTSTKG
jgi:hypothetical protein